MKQVTCKLCGSEEGHEGTNLCDRCWELSRRIEADPKLALKVLMQIKGAMADALMPGRYVKVVEQRERLIAISLQVLSDLEVASETYETTSTAPGFRSGAGRNPSELDVTEETQHEIRKAISDIRVGQELTVFEDPFTRQKPEGRAKLVTFIRAANCTEPIHWEDWFVRFEGEEVDVRRRIAFI